MADLREPGIDANGVGGLGLKFRRRVAAWWLMGLSILALLLCLIWGVDARGSGTYVAVSGPQVTAASAAVAAPPAPASIPR